MHLTCQQVDSATATQDAAYPACAALTVNGYLNSGRIRALWLFQCTG